MSAAATTPSPLGIPMAAPARSSRRETLTRLLRTPTFLIATFVIVNHQDRWLVANTHVTSVQNP